MVVMLNLLALAAHAEKCESVLNKCDAALKAEQQVVLEQKSLISQQNQKIDLLQKDLNIEQEKNRAWYTNPLIVAPSAILLWEIIGIALKK